MSWYVWLIGLGLLVVGIGVFIYRVNHLPLYRFDGVADNYEHGGSRGKIWPIIKIIFLIMAIASFVLFMVSLETDWPKIIFLTLWSGVVSAHLFFAINPRRHSGVLRQVLSEIQNRWFAFTIYAILFLHLIYTLFERG